MSSPLRAVLDAIGGGARSRADVCAATALRGDVVDAAIAHLVRIGRLEATRLSTGCPDGGCGTCASGVDEAPGCGASRASAARSGPALVQLTVRPNPSPSPIRH